MEQTWIRIFFFVYQGDWKNWITIIHVNLIYMQIFSLWI